MISAPWWTCSTAIVDTRNSIGSRPPQWAGRSSSRSSSRNDATAAVKARCDRSSQSRAPAAVPGTSKPGSPSDPSSNAYDRYTSVHAQRWTSRHAIVVTGSGSGGGQTSSQIHSPVPQPGSASPRRRTDQQLTTGSQKYSSSSRPSTSTSAAWNARWSCVRSWSAAPAAGCTESMFPHFRPADARTDPGKVRPKAESGRCW